METGLAISSSDPQSFIISFIPCLLSIATILTYAILENPEFNIENRHYIKKQIYYKLAFQLQSLMKSISHKYLKYALNILTTITILKHNYNNTARENLYYFVFYTLQNL